MRTRDLSSETQESYLVEQSQKGRITVSNLVLIAFTTAFFSRILDALGVPAAVNFLHFITIPWVCGFVIAKSRIKDHRQALILQEILWGLGILLSVVTASALLNNAGMINIVLSFLLLGEPFIWVLAIIALPLSSTGLERFRFWWMRFGLINLLFAFIQAFVLRVGQSNPDYIKGVFIGQGAGHVVGGSISLAFVVYYFASAKDRPIWVRASLLVAAFVHIMTADAKQVLLVFLEALVLLILLKVQDIRKFIQYMAISITFVGLLVLAANTVFGGLLTWADLDVQREGMALKMSGFSIIPTFYHSWLNWLLGLGPGHTVGRLGGWLVWSYQDLLKPLDVTVSQASVAVWDATSASWLGDKSSWFPPLFTWSGIWGDLGFVGLAAYIYLWALVWRRLCYDDLSKFFVLSVLLFGLILTQMEEPGFMLFVTGILALRWQEHRGKNSNDM